MRNVRRKADPDRGAVMIWFAASVVVSLGMGALVVDMGALWSERRQLQNGADAAALAVAMDCAANQNCGPAQQMATDYANLNSADDFSNIDSLCGSKAPLVFCPPPPEAAGAAGYVEVITGTRNGGGDEVDFLLAPILDGGNSGKHVTARAVAAWKAASSGKVIAMVLSQCFAFPLDGSMKRMPYADGSFCNSGQTPQGFDFTVDGDRDCLVLVSLLTNGTNVLPKDSEGNNPNCADILQEAVDTGEPLLFPIAVSRTGTGSNAEYTIDGFALVEVCGYRIPSGRHNGCCPGNNNQNRVCGTFVRGTLLNGDWGSGRDYGASVVKLVG